jgi:peptidoglycan/LPS O-acetylase OafA/YrhL
MTVSAESGPAWSHVERSGVVARERDGVIDTMRGVAILMVIGIHSLPKTDGSALVTAIDALLRPCVPIFLFASGYLTAQSGHVPLAKRVKRALGPYTIAFIAAYLFMALNNPSMDNRPAVIVARYAFAYVFVYYYVFVYIGCTIVLWLVFAAAGEAEDGRRQRLIILLALAIVAGLTVGAYLDPLLQRFGVPASAIEEVRMRDLPFWFAVVAAGAIVGSACAEGAFRDLRYWLAAATVMAYAAYAAIRIGSIGDAADYDSIAFFLYAALFCTTMLGFSRDWPALAMLGSASYFLYLWHIFVIMALRQVPALQQHAVVSVAIEFSAALIVSAVVALAIRRVAGPRLVQWLGV